VHLRRASGHIRKDAAHTNPWTLSALSLEQLEGIQGGTMGYQYRGIPCYKNPFDLALYTMLLWEQKPQTIIELGSGEGGSAVWFASQLEALGLPGAVYSFDITPVTTVEYPGVTFAKADIHALDASLSKTFIDSLPRPFLIIEDGPHTFDASLAAMKFFDRYLSPGDYLVIEDGIVLELGLKHYDNGPRRAIDQFLSETDGRYIIDRRLCDYYGTNVTWNTNGYLTCVADSPTDNTPESW